MKITELKAGMKVFDRWYLDWGTGVVDKVLKTRVFIKFPYPKGMMKYDEDHTMFLAKAKK